MGDVLKTFAAIKHFWLKYEKTAGSVTSDEPVRRAFLSHKLLNLHELSGYQ